MKSVLITGYSSGDLCINMNNHQNTTFYPFDNFIKTCRSPAGTGFNKITKSAKSVILLIIPIYAKVSSGIGLCIAQSLKQVDYQANYEKMLACLQSKDLADFTLPAEAVLKCCVHALSAKKTKIQLPCNFSN